MGHNTRNMMLLEVPVSEMFLNCNIQCNNGQRGNNNINKIYDLPL